jgi:hypothetical protein
MAIDAHHLQQDLNKLDIWEGKRKMAFHPDKLNVLSVNRNNNPIKFNYTLNGHLLESLQEAKYLGLTIRQD